MKTTFDNDISYLTISIDNGNQICIPYKNVKILYKRLKQGDEAPFKGLFHIQIDSASKPLPLKFREELLELLKSNDTLISKISHAK